MVEGSEFSTRVHLQSLAARGDARAIAELEGARFPDELEYLYDWAQELYGRSGVSLDGLAPLSYMTIDAWARLTDQHPAPHEVHALMALDLVMRRPEVGAEG